MNRVQAVSKVGRLLWNSLALVAIAFFTVPACKSDAPGREAEVFRLKSEATSTLQEMSKDMLFTELKLFNDGTFEFSMKVKVMIDLDSRATGTYKEANDTITLTGTETFSSDDGYKKSSGTRDFSQTWYRHGDLLRSIKNSDSPVDLKRVR